MDALVDSEPLQMDLLLTEPVDETCEQESIKYE
jgi:hypothetical protein